MSSFVMLIAMIVVANIAYNFGKHIRNKTENTTNRDNYTSHDYTSYSYDYQPSKNALLHDLSYQLTGKKYAANDYPPNDNAILRDIRNHLSQSQKPSSYPESNASLLQDIAKELTGKTYSQSDYPPSENAILRDIRNSLKGSQSYSEYPQDDASLLQDIQNELVKRGYSKPNSSSFGHKQGQRSNQPLHVRFDRLSKDQQIQVAQNMQTWLNSPEGREVVKGVNDLARKYGKK